MKRSCVQLLFAFVVLLPVVSAQDTGAPTADNLSATSRKRPYSPNAGGAVPTRVFWGDTHLHTSFSVDAGAFGNRLGLEEAYRFARGEQVQSTTAGPVRLLCPLDFLVIADHSDNMGFFPDLISGDPRSSATPKEKNSTTAFIPETVWGWRLS